MDKVIELADTAGMCYVDAHRTITCTESALHKFYTLARADLEASNKQLQHDLNEQLYQVKAYDERCQDLEAENAGLWKEREEPLKDAALFMSECNRLERERDALKAENAKLKEALHHISLCSQNSMSSQRQCGEIARAAIGENK